MARALMKLYGSRLGLVGMTRGKDPVGRWVIKEICGTPYIFFSVCHGKPSGKKPFVPARLTFYVGLRRFRKEIVSLGCRAAFIQAPEALLAISRWDWESLCFWFPGVENPLKRSRYAFAKPVSRLFDHALFSALNRVSVILGAADENAIQALVSRSQGRLCRERVIQVPTCVDTSVFHPVRADRERAALGIPAGPSVFVTSGRIGRLKGWELLLDAFERFLRCNSNALLFFVGDGEDRYLLEAQIEARGLSAKVKITGFQNPTQVASYLAAANVVVFGSYLEGWSVSMLEALACGKAIVSTEVSGADAMIKQGLNGFVVKGRDPEIFAQAMKEAISLSKAEQVSSSLSCQFTLTAFGERLARLWPPLSANALNQ
jgi:glycosyltransferase involved in cell wall biosynthesis